MYQMVILQGGRPHTTNYLFCRQTLHWHRGLTFSKVELICIENGIDLRGVVKRPDQQSFERK